MKVFHSSNCTGAELRAALQRFKFGRSTALAFPQVLCLSAIGGGNSLGTRPILCGSITVLRVFRLWFNFLIANVDYSAITILINYFKPAAGVGILGKVVVRVIGKYITRAKTIA